MDYDDTEVVRETKIRYVHHKSTEEVGISKNNTGSKYNNLHLCSSGTDTIVLEKLENGTVVSLRLLNINYRRITPSFFNDYNLVTKLEVGCPVSITWMFRYLPRFEKLNHFRFGRLAFEDREEDSTSTINFKNNPTVHSYELAYNVADYSKLTVGDQKLVDMRISAALQLGLTTFPNLEHCDIQVPKSIEKELDSFLARFPQIQNAGEKRLRYSEGFVAFSNKDFVRRPQSSPVLSSDQTSTAGGAKRLSRAGSSTSTSSSSTSASINDKPRKAFFLKKPKMEVSTDANDEIEEVYDHLTPPHNPDSTSDHQVKAVPIFHDPRLARGRRGRSPSMEGPTGDSHSSPGL